LDCSLRKKTFTFMFMKTLLIVSGLLTALAACNGTRNFAPAEDAQDAGRQFIRASLDGDYEKAVFYLLKDSTNQMLMDKWKKEYDHIDERAKNQYRDAEILPIRIQTLNDSVTRYSFSNSYKRDTSTLLIVRINGEWLVDLKEILNAKK